MGAAFQNDESSNADCAAAQAARRPHDENSRRRRFIHLAKSTDLRTIKPAPDFILASIGYDEPVGRRFRISKPHGRQPSLAERDQHVYAFEFDDFTRDRLCFLETENPLHFKH
jgi:hypothetical protein